MSSTYRFHKPPERQAAFGPLEEGDYNFIVSECGEPYEKNDKFILPVKIAIQPDGVPVFANPWAGTDKNGNDRDGIAEFLISCNRAPKVGEEPDWDEVAGARGRCHLKQEEAQMGALKGKMVNKVGWFIAPKQVGPSASKQSVSKNEFEKARQKQVEASGGGAGEIDEDNIPYACDRY